MSTHDPAPATEKAGGRAGAVTAVAPTSPEAPGLGPVSQRVADVVLAHPAVAALSGGPFGTVATYLPGRRLVGVSLGDGQEPTRVAVVLHFGAPVHATAAALRQLVAAESGAVQVDVLVTDLQMPETVETAATPLL